MPEKIIKNYIYVYFAFVSAMRYYTHSWKCDTESSQINSSLCESLFLCHV